MLRSLHKSMTSLLPFLFRWRFTTIEEGGIIGEYRLKILRKHAAKDALGIEIAPWCRPLVSKREGYHSKAIDIFDTEKLRANAITANLEAYLPNLEEVDFVGDACSIADIIGPFHGPASIHYVISSHNFEHLPDPIRFLQGCGHILIDGGVLSMAIPDKRGSFDYFRPLSTTGSFLDAFFDERIRPTPLHRFDEHSLHCRYKRDSLMLSAFDLSDDPAGVTVVRSIESAFGEWVETRRQGLSLYHDCHCSIFTPASFQLILLDLHHLRLCDLKVMEAGSLPNGEFFVHLKKDDARLETEDYYVERARLLKAIVAESAINAPGTRRGALRKAWARRQRLLRFARALRD